MDVQASGALRGVVTVEHLHDIGKLLFAFTVFWTYIAFCQYFLIWYGNLPEETSYFMHRSQGSWPAIGKILIVGHFAIPFFFLMPRAMKRSVPLLVTGASWLLVMHFMDLYWCVMPVHLQDEIISLGGAGGSLLLGSPIYHVTTVSSGSSYTATTSNYIIIVNKSSGSPTTITLPEQPAIGQVIIVKDGKGDAAANPITVSSAAGKIDGAAKYVLRTNYQAAQFVYHGAGWAVF